MLSYLNYMNSNEVTILTDAILELYLAIKIRSSEEVSKYKTDRALAREYDRRTSRLGKGVVKVGNCVLVARLHQTKC